MKVKTSETKINEMLWWIILSLKTVFLTCGHFQLLELQPNAEFLVICLTYIHRGTFPKPSWDAKNTNLFTSIHLYMLTKVKKSTIFSRIWFYFMYTYFMYAKPSLQIYKLALRPGIQQRMHDILGAL